MTLATTLTLWLSTLAAIATTCVGFIVWSAQKHNNIRQSFLILTIFVGLWIMSNVLFGFVGDEQRYPTALFSYAFAMAVVINILIFCLILVNRTKVKLWRYMKVAAVGLIAAVVSAIPGVIAVSVKDSRIITHSVPLGIYGVIISTYLIASLVVLIVARRRAQPLARRQIDLILLGIAASSIAGVLFNLVFPLFGEYDFVQLGPTGTVFFVGAMTYVIARHGLFDVRLAIVRSTIYFLILSTFAGVYFAVIHLVSPFFDTSLSRGQITLNIIATLLMAMVLKPLKKFFDHLTSKIFYRDSYDISDFYQRLGRTLTLTTDLRGLLQRASAEIATTIKAENVFFYINSKNSRHISAGLDNVYRMPRDDVDTLDEYIKTQDSGDIIIVELLPVGSHIRRLLISHKIALVLPLRRVDDNVGYLFLGNKKISSYTRRDLRVLMTIRDELIIAIQNTRSVQQLKELNDTLQQRIDNATKELRASNEQLQRLDEAKDEFVGLASHQLRTPLTSVKGYISMVLEGDAGRITGPQKHLLGEAFTSSERMVRLINDFLNVSRLQTGKFLIDKRPVCLAKVVEHELDSLATNATSRNLKFSYEPPKDFPMLDLDEGKIEQVIMNFADNALYYSPEGTTIVVNLSVKDDEVIFTVKDSGIGVPKSEQARLFSKFYRASNARKQRPDGTGVGLFLAKKVIDSHGGKVIFESTEGHGSTFGFSLPLKKLRSVDNSK